MISITEKEARKLGFLKKEDDKIKKKKYHNHECELFGEKFDGLGERGRYNYLKYKEKTGEIQNLQRQVKFVIQEKFKDCFVETHRAIKYYADFVYNVGDLTYIEDYKGNYYNSQTTDFKIKFKLLKFKFKDEKNIIILVNKIPTADVWI